MATQKFKKFTRGLEDFERIQDRLEENKRRKEALDTSNSRKSKPSINSITKDDYENNS